jgi:alpha-ribazole phosphatase
MNDGSLTSGTANDGSTHLILYAWRHPRAIGAEGRCIGHTDLPVDPRRAKRLAHRIRCLARQHGLPRIVITSQLQRSRAVGQWLSRWGWQHHVDPALAEMFFGSWEGQRWSDISQCAVDTWCDDFLHHAPGDGECLATLLQRVLAFDRTRTRIIVTHGGWLAAAHWLARHAHAAPRADQWPTPPRHGTLCKLI